MLAQNNLRRRFRLSLASIAIIMHAMLRDGTEFQLA